MPPYYANVLQSSVVRVDDDVRRAKVPLESFDGPGNAANAAIKNDSVALGRDGSAVDVVDITDRSIRLLLLYHREAPIPSFGGI